MFNLTTIKRQNPKMVQVHHFHLSAGAPVTHGCEVWAMKKEDKNILRRFERKIMRRTYGPVRQGREWRTRNNEEIYYIIRKKDIVRRIGWIGHVERMEDKK
jgi:hypothetical protein